MATTNAATPIEMETFFILLFILSIFPPANCLRSYLHGMDAPATKKPQEL
jgi:hypothetical protein